MKEVICFINGVILLVIAFCIYVGQLNKLTCIFALIVNALYCFVKFFRMVTQDKIKLEE